MHRIALIADIHGNDHALDAVLSDIERAGVDEVICLGDVATLGPSPARCLERISELGCRCVMGNHDAFLLDPGLVGEYSDVPAIHEAVAWCRDQLRAAALEFVATFEVQVELDLDGQTTLLCCHGSPASFTQDILSTTPAEEVEGMLAGCDARLVACAHTHIQMVRQHRGTLIVNPGSVGMPFLEYVGGQTPTLLDHAEYGIVEAQDGRVTVTQHRLPLDRGALHEAARDSELPLRSWLIEQYG